MSVAALVLAAGGGSRYEGPTHKLLAPLGGRPLVSAAIEAASTAGFDEIAVVMGAVDLRGIAPAGITLLENPAWAEGLSSSLRTGIAWCEAQGHDAVVIGLGDAPGIPSAAWSSLRATRAPVAVASFSGRPHPPVRLERSLFSSVPRSGDVGARALWQQPGTVIVECDGDPSDIDTVEDLARFACAES